MLIVTNVEHPPPTPHRTENRTGCIFKLFMSEISIYIIKGQNKGICTSLKYVKHLKLIKKFIICVCKVIAGGLNIAG